MITVENHGVDAFPHASKNGLFSVSVNLFSYRFCLELVRIRQGLPMMNLRSTFDGLDQSRLPQAWTFGADFMGEIKQQFCILSPNCQSVNTLTQLSTQLVLSCRLQSLTRPLSLRAPVIALDRVRWVVTSPLVFIMRTSVVCVSINQSIIFRVA